MTTGRGNEAEAEAEAGASLPSPAAASHGSPSSKATTTTTHDKHGSDDQANNPPLPDEAAPPLPDQAPPEPDDDGWEHSWDSNAKAWYFYNRRTGVSQWENPRVPNATASHPGGNHRNTAAGGAAALTSTSGAPGTTSPPKRKWGGYNPAIHGSYDPNADYAQQASKEEEEAEEAAAAALAAARGGPNSQGQDYAAAAHFNRFTGKFQQAEVGPDMHNDENKSKRQMSAFFDVDAAANSHDGRSLKAERRSKALSRKELQAYKDKRRDKKEEKRRAWLRD